MYPYTCARHSLTDRKDLQYEMHCVAFVQGQLHSDTQRSLGVLITTPFIPTVTLDPPAEHKHV